MVRDDSPKLFCLPCERPVEPSSVDAGTDVTCPDCGGGLVGPHPDPCVKCGGARTPDGLYCLDCGRLDKSNASAEPRAKFTVQHLLSHAVILSLGVFLGWKVIVSIQSGVFTRAGWRHDILASEEPIWFWISISLNILGAALCTLPSIGLGRSTLSRGRR
jgi:hypothetical protein